MSRDEMKEYRQAVERCTRTRRKRSRLFNEGRRAQDHNAPTFFDVPLILMALCLVLVGVWLVLNV
jgi:hypothetical protein